MIIDSHVHLENFYKTKIPLSRRLENLKRFMKDAKIDQAIILCCVDAVNTKAVPIKKMLELVKKEDNLHVVGTLSINYTPEEFTYVKRLLKAKKLIAIKLYPGYEEFYPEDHRLDVVYTLCEEYDVPVIFHSGETFETGIGVKYSMPIHIDDLAIRKPNLKIVVAHLGNPWLNDIMTIVNRNKNVYADISALVWHKFDDCWGKYYSEAIVRIIKWNDLKDHKLLFGTDWPCNDERVYASFMKNYVHFANQLKISDYDKDLLFYKNAQKVFKI